MASAGGGSRGSVRPERHVQTGRGGNGASSSVRTKSAPPKRPSSSSSAKSSIDSDNAADAIRVRVAVRLRPKNKEDFTDDGDFTSCVELQTETKKLRLKKNNWSSEMYKFDEVFTEGSSQRRVYEAVAKPVVESVLEGYNGTVMAYGQTGTGKTYTMGHLGKSDPSERGIMVRALEDILASVSTSTDSVAISYLQLYLESLQDLLAPDKTNISIVEDAKSGEVYLPGAAVVELRDLNHFNELLHYGEANRYASNTKLNTESSRSHAILVVHVQRSVKVKDENDGTSTDDISNSNNVPIILKSKLLIVDLAGSERIDKSGSVEGHLLEEAKFINLSLTSLGKCINALAENSPYIPTRDSKLTRILRDSFGGTARTSLIITIGPSVRYYSETSSTIMFGQRAMKIVNTVKLKEEVDYESLYKKLECQVDSLTSELERVQKIRQEEKTKMERKLRKSEESLAELKRTFTMKCENLEKKNDCMKMEMKKLTEELNDEREQNKLLSDKVVEMEMSLSQNKQQQLENSKYKKALSDSSQMYEDRIKELLGKVEEEQARCAYLELELRGARQEVASNDNSSKMQDYSNAKELQNELLHKLKEESRSEIQQLEAKNKQLLSEKDLVYEELKSMQEKVMQETRHRRSLEDEILKLKKVVSKNGAEQLERGTSMLRTTSGFSSGGVYLPRTGKSRDSGQNDTRSKTFEGVGLSTIIALLKSEDLDVQCHAVKVIANCAAEDINQAKIIEEGGLDALFSLLETSENIIIHRATAGAIANLAMNGPNQALIINKGGARLLANVATTIDDPQTLRMVAGAIANLCGNEKLHVKLKEDGGIKALVGMVRSGNADVIAQIARGIANFAKSESRAISQGHRKGRSLLIDDGALKWMVTSYTSFSASTRKHIELAFCHLSQNEENTRDIITTGGIKELVRISQESERDDIRILAKKALNSNPAFLREIQ
ncbi:armadillo/beta-catenin repeat family protein / kinesin motor family protein [Carex rostrata]